VFPTNISKFLPPREVDFSIESIPRVAPTSKASYRMSTPELVELMLQLKEFLARVILGKVYLLGVHQCCL